MPATVATKKKEFQFKGGVKFFNRVFASYKNKTFDAQQIMERAQKTSGLTYFGDDFFVEPLHRLVDDINEETEFHAVGAFLYYNKILLNLINRLWARHWLNTQVNEFKSMPPTVLITGLQRTGTTFLQRLLGALPEFRGILSWEVVNPVPKSKAKRYFGKYQSAIGHHMLNYVSPEFKSIHSVKAESLEEEAALMDHTFMSSIAEASLNVPNYAKWLDKQDHLPAYQDLRRWIQLLLWRKPAKNYLLLKSPHHMEHMDEFIQMFPDTKVIHTHRTPVETMASYCSMVQYGKKIFLPSCDPHQIGDHWLRKNQKLMSGCLDFRSRHKGLFMDVSYHNLVKDPIAQAQAIYQFLNLRWTDNHSSLAVEFCKQHKKNKYGKHVYSLSDYGLEASQVEGAFSDYLNQFESYLKA